jgi:hypothetical protein
MIRLAQEANDQELAFALYRRQIDARQWQQDILQLGRAIPDSDQLNDELRKRHPEGWGIKLGPGILALLKLRGRDVFPYVREKLHLIVGVWSDRSMVGPLLDFAESQSWWDLTAAIARTATDPKFFHREIQALLDDTRLDDATRQERLRALAGVSREWNGPGLGVAQVHPLEDGLAVRLYDRYPDLIRGPFKPHVVPTWWSGGPKLLAAALSAGDDELVDLLASRYVTRPAYSGVVNPQGQDTILPSAQQLAWVYQQLRDRDGPAFARRAGNVLTQIPAFAIHAYDQLLRSNDLARLLFVRSFPAYLAAPEAVRDLIESSEIHVQMLGYRILAQDDERARRLTAETLDILQGTLLRPLHRRTRLAAFEALLNAARHDRPSATRILQRCRDALRLPERRYPREELVGLIGRILHRWPELCGPRERPVVYGLVERVP